MDTSSNSNSTPKVYRKLVDYSTHRALECDAAVQLENSLIVRSQHASPVVSKCNKLRCCKGREKFLTKSASVRNNIVTDSPLAFARFDCHVRAVGGHHGAIKDD